MTAHDQNFPRYPSIIPTALAVIGSRMLGHKRSFHTDAVRLAGRNHSLLKIEGAEHIPSSGGALIVVNHYARPGYSSAWNALALAAATPREITFVMSDAWAFEGNLLGFLLRPVMRAFLAGISAVYGFLSMPSMAPRFNDAQSRAKAVRRVIRFVRAHPDAVIGLAPEGQDSPPGGVGLAPAGGGKFMLQLNRMGLPVVPAAVAEKAGQLTLKFGEAFELMLDPGLPAVQVDETVRLFIREKIYGLYQSIQVKKST